MIRELNDTMKELAIYAYKTKKNVFMYRNQGYHLNFLSQRVNGRSKLIGLEIRACDYKNGKWVTVGKIPYTE